MAEENTAVISQHLEHTDKLDKLASAILKVQSVIEPAVKDAESHHGSYADLFAVWDAARGPLDKDSGTNHQCRHRFHGTNNTVSPCCLGSVHQINAGDEARTTRSTGVRKHGDLCEEILTGEPTWHGEHGQVRRR